MLILNIKQLIKNTKNIIIHRYYYIIDIYYTFKHLKHLDNPDIF